MNTPFGLNRFSRVIVTKRDGTCLFCQGATRQGVDFAAVNAQGAWTACCATCAQSLTAQAAGLVHSIEVLAATGTIDESAVPMPVEDNLMATLTGQASEATAYDTIVGLINARTAVEGQLRGAQPELPCVPGLRTIAADATASPRDRDFAQSLLAQYDRSGRLSEKQVAAAERMVARTSSTSTPAAALENGLYLHESGKVFKLYTTQNGYQACKVLAVYGNHGSFEFLKGGVRVVREAVAAGNAHPMTQDEAAAFGRLHGFCCNCGLDIDDDRSLAAGYGPVCARNHGWFYPTYEEAAQMLGRPVTNKSTGKVYGAPVEAAPAAAAPAPMTPESIYEGARHIFDCAADAASAGRVAMTLGRKALDDCDLTAATEIARAWADYKAANGI